jgi:predicted DNA-binding transcriptional regulator YafY
MLDSSHPIGILGARDYPPGQDPATMSDDPALRRQWLLLRSLSASPGGRTVREMAAEAGVADKTVRRDLALFRSVGFPLEELVGDFGRKSWRLAGARNQPPLGFTFDEAVALYLGRRLLEPLAGTLFWDAALRAFQKVRATLTPAARDYLDRFAGSFHQTAFGAHDYARRADLIDALQIAVEDGRVVRLLYRSERSDQATRRDVHPCGLIYHRGSLYLAAIDPDGGKTKHYKVDRVEDAEVLPVAALRPRGFDPSAHLAAAFGVYQSDGPIIAVKVRFDRAAARYVRESAWHASQRLTAQPDGGVVAEFRLSATEELKRWVLSFGARAVVLEPESLRREIAEELAALAEVYSRGRVRDGRRGARGPARKPRSGVRAEAGEPLPDPRPVDQD